ncbi:MAG: carboxypeptidase-like regulatory domain-containing protein [Balneolales bacterium]|nr:carboxypeptidase-like regulatory domain-containing protein [Balneolales bacterium]
MNTTSVVKIISFVVILGLMTFSLSAFTGTSINTDAEPMSDAPMFEVSGIVTDASTEEPVHGAVVSLHGHDLSTVTDHNGAFSFSDLPEGELTIVIEAEGYDDTEKDIYVNGDSHHLEIELEPEND